MREHRGRRAYRAGHYEWDLTVKAGSMTLKSQKLKGALSRSETVDGWGLWTFSWWKIIVFGNGVSG